MSGSRLSRMAEGEWKECRVVAELIRRGVDVYRPCVDDRGIDCVVRQETDEGVIHVDVQIKGSNGYNRIVGVRRKQVESKDDGYIVIIAYFHHGKKPDEFFFLTKGQVLRLKDEAFGEGGDGGWGDLIFNKPERKRFAHQDLNGLAAWLESGCPALTA